MYCKCGSLGCGIGYGYLHRIPTRSTESTSPKAFPPSGSSSPVKAPLPGTGFNEVRLLFAVLCHLVYLTLMTHTHTHTLKYSCRFLMQACTSFLYKFLVSDFDASLCRFLCNGHRQPIRPLSFGHVPANFLHGKEQSYAGNLYEKNLHRKSC